MQSQILVHDVNKLQTHLNAASNVNRSVGVINIGSIRKPI